MGLKGKKQSFNILKGEGEDAELQSFDIELDEGMVVLDCVHRIQHEQQPALVDNKSELPAKITSTVVMPSG